MRHETIVAPAITAWTRNLLAIVLFMRSIILLCRLVAAIYHGLLTILMLPFGLIGRKFYRRKSDGTQLASGNDVTKTDAVGLDAIN